MGMQYQLRDWDVVDYQEYPLTNNFYARGPALPKIEPKRYFACVGAAQTFGCFCEEPYPLILQEWLSLGALNLGYGGAGPRFFVKDAILMKYINEAKFVIVQVMSGRSEDNSLFSSGGLEWLTRLSDGVQLGAERAWREMLATHDLAFVQKIVTETRQNWLTSFQSLLAKITPPKILLWFAQRGPDYVENFHDVHSLFGGFPQLVNGAMIAQVRSCCDQYAECVSSRGMPQPLRNRFTAQSAVVNFVGAARKGEEPHPSSYNSYYPSPEMQFDAARAMQSACLKYRDGAQEVFDPWCGPLLAHPRPDQNRQKNEFLRGHRRGRRRKIEGGRKRAGCWLLQRFTAAPRNLGGDDGGIGLRDWVVKFNARPGRPDRPQSARAASVAERCASRSAHREQPVPRFTASYGSLISASGVSRSSVSSSPCCAPWVIASSRPPVPPVTPKPPHFVGKLAPDRRDCLGRFLFVAMRFAFVPTLEPSKPVATTKKRGCLGVTAALVITPRPRTQLSISIKSSVRLEEIGRKRASLPAPYSRAIEV